MSTPNIADKALLVKMSISQWYNRAVDTKVANEVAAQYGTEDHSDRYIKTLVPKKALDGINSAINGLREFHNGITLPWMDGGVRILPSGLFMRYREEMAKLQSQFDKAVKEFAKDFPNWVEEAKKTKKGLFDETQYPSPSAVKDQFALGLSFLPFPNSKDFRVSLSPAELKEIKKSMDVEIEVLMRQATGSLFQRATKMLDKLWTTAREADKIFRNTTVTNLMEFLDDLPQLNIAKDGRLTSLVNAAKFIHAIDTDAMRTNAEYRADIADKVKKLREMIPSE